MNLYLVDFCTSTNTEDRDTLFVFESDQFPDKKDVEEALTDCLYCGAVYVDNIKEIDEAYLMSSLKEIKYLGLPK